METLNKRLWLFLLFFSLTSMLTGQTIMKNKERKENPAPCEFAQSTLSVIHNLAKGKNIIIISRLGNGEVSNSLHKKRLSSAKKFYIDSWNRPADTIITASGDRVKGLGRLDIFLDGNYLDKILIGKNASLYVNCVTD